MGIKSGLDPLSDYLKNGWRKHLNPNGWFNVKLYLEDHPEVMAAGMDPLKHYIEKNHAAGSAN